MICDVADMPYSLRNKQPDHSQVRTAEQARKIHHAPQKTVACRVVAEGRRACEEMWSTSTLVEGNLGNTGPGSCGISNGWTFQERVGSGILVLCLLWSASLQSGSCPYTATQADDLLSGAKEEFNE